MSDLWSIASADHEAEVLETHLTTARLAAAQYWPVVAAATDERDFANRLALVDDSLATVATNIAAGDPVLFGVVHSAIKTGFAEDFTLLHETRVQAAREAAGRRGRRVASAEDALKALRESTDKDALQRTYDQNLGLLKQILPPGSKEEIEAQNDVIQDRIKSLSSRKTAGQTCSVCGDAIEKDPSGEANAGWHHDNGEKHDHEAKPSGDSKESSRRVALSVGDGVPCHRCGNITTVEDPNWGTFQFCPACQAILAAEQQARGAQGDDFERRVKEWSDGGGYNGDGKYPSYFGSRQASKVNPFARTAGENPFAKKDDDEKKDDDKPEKKDDGGNPFAKKDDAVADPAAPADPNAEPVSSDTPTDTSGVQPLLDAGYQAHTQGGKTLEEAIAAGEPIQFQPPAAASAAPGPVPAAAAPTTPPVQPTASRRPFAGSKTAASDGNKSTDDFYTYNDGGWSSSLDQQTRDSIARVDPDNGEVQPTPGMYKAFEQWVASEYGADALGAYYGRGREASRRRASRRPFGGSKTAATEFHVGDWIEILERGEWIGPFLVEALTGRDADHLVCRNTRNGVIFEQYNDAPYNTRLLEGSRGLHDASRKQADVEYGGWYISGEKCPKCGEPLEERNELQSAAFTQQACGNCGYTNERYNNA